jgi:hypothetical protein
VINVLKAHQQGKHGNEAVDREVEIEGTLDDQEQTHFYKKKLYKINE